MSQKIIELRDKSNTYVYQRKINAYVNCIFFIFSFAGIISSNVYWKNRVVLLQEIVDSIHKANANSHKRENRQ